MSGDKSIFSDWLVDEYGSKPETNRVLVGYTDIDHKVEFGIKQMGHTLISGMSRSGKSQMALNLLKSLTKFASVAVYTPKMNDYFDFRHGVEVLDDKQMAKVIRKAVGELERRNKRVLRESEKAGEVVQPDESPIILMIDEFQTFRGSIDEGTFIALQRLMNEGAGLSIFIYIITQIPNKRILDGSLRENIMTDIAFKQRDSYASRMAVGSRDAEFLELRQCIVRNVADKFIVTRM